MCSPCERVEGACEAAGDDARCIDLGEGTTAGRVCGRGCAADAECSAGFTCRATTEAGDRQCVSSASCTNGANACASDAQCKTGQCRAGACVGPSGPSDAGADASDGGTPDAGGSDAGPSVEPGGGGCSCHVVGTDDEHAPRPPPMKPLLALLGALALCLTLRRRRGSPRCAA